MPIDRTAGTVAISSQSVSAGSSVQSSSVTMLDTNFAATVYGRITNGATGPTIPMRVALEVTPDGGTTWIDTGLGFSGGGANSGVFQFSFDVPFPIGTWRVNAGSHTGQAVTVAAWYDLVVTPQ